MTERIRLSAIEISAILAVAGTADAPAVFEHCLDEQEGERMLTAFEYGMEKLRRMLATGDQEND